MEEIYFKRSTVWRLTFEDMSNDPYKYFLRLKQNRARHLPSIKEIPEEVLKDDNRIDAAMLIQRQEADEQTWLELVKKYPKFRPFVGWNKTIPLTVLEALAKDKTHEYSYMSRCLVAIHDSVSEDLLLKLSKDPHDYVRQAVAVQPKTPIKILQELSQDPVKQVRRKAKEKLKERGAL